MLLQNVKNEQLEDRKLRFYRIMWYPIPIEKDVFLYDCKKSVKSSNLSFSWEEKCEWMDEYLKFINKWGGLFKNFPFVREVYLANSISFNALSSDSDIDLFVITENWRVWTSRLLVSFLMMLFWIKRTKNNYKKKFCLSFFVDKNNSNLEKILLNRKDIYLPYWIAHLVPLYVEEKNPEVFKNNQWIKRFLPNIWLTQNIYLWNVIISWRWYFKKYVEFLLDWDLWDKIENIIQEKWGNRMKKIIAKNPDMHKWVVCENWMLKFYKDMRKYYSDLFFSNDN